MENGRQKERVKLEIKCIGIPKIQVIFKFQILTSNFIKCSYINTIKGTIVEELN